MFDPLEEEDNCYTKSKVLDKIQEMIAAQFYENCIIYYSGPATKKGNWLI